MKTTKSISVILLLLLNITLIFSQENNLSAFTDKYDNRLKQNTQGVAMLIKKEGKVHTVSMGKHGLSDKSVFNIGSATKTMTSVLILQEVEKGNLKLSDSIGTYLDPIKNIDGALTIKQLLTHETGLNEVIGKNIQEIFYAKSDSLYRNELLYQTKNNSPGMIGKFDYCNTNYFVLGKVIEKLKDQSYFDVLREQIFIPLQMQNTHPYVHKNLPNLAIPMHEGDDVTEFLDYRYFANVAFAAGSVASTLTDMEIFFTALFETEKLLRKETLQRMMQMGNDSYGLGLFKPTDLEDNYFGHGGNNIGYSFRNGYNPETKNLYLLFSNTRTIPQKNVLISDVKAFLNGQTITQFKTIDVATFKKYEGKYLLAEADLEMEIVLENNKFYLIVTAQNMKSELVQNSEISLMDATVGATLSIIEDSNTILRFEQNGFSTTISKVSVENEVSTQK